MSRGRGGRRGGTRVGHSSGDEIPVVPVKPSPPLGGEQKKQDGASSTVSFVSEEVSL